MLRQAENADAQGKIVNIYRYQILLNETTN